MYVVMRELRNSPFDVLHLNVKHSPTDREQFSTIGSLRTLLSAIHCKAESHEMLELFWKINGSTQKG